jgi:hypothetical protein
MKQFLVIFVFVASMAFGADDALQSYVTGLASAVAMNADWEVTECPRGLSVRVAACAFGSGSSNADKFSLDVFVPRLVSWSSPWVRSSPEAVGRAMSTPIGEVHVMVYEVSRFVTLVFFWVRLE